MEISPVVSIVMPVYNAEKYLLQCMDSIIGQTLKNIEIICVNDASTDRSLQILHEYANADSRIRVIDLENNSKAGECRNIGLARAKGEYCIFLDADDFFADNMLELAIAKAKATGADITAFNYYRFDEKTNGTTLRNGVRKYMMPKGLEVFNYHDYPERILDVIDPVPWNKLYRTAFIKKSGLKFLKTSTTNDVTFTSLTLAMANSITYIEDPLVFYRVNTNHSITSEKLKNLDNIIIATEAVVKGVRELAYYNEIYPSLLYFIMAKYVFSLRTYGGSVNSEHYRDFYKKVFRVFNSKMFADVTVDFVKDKKLFAEFEKIKHTSYKKLVNSSLLKKIKPYIKKHMIRYSLTKEIYMFLVTWKNQGFPAACKKVKMSIKKLSKNPRNLLHPLCVRYTKIKAYLRSRQRKWGVLSLKFPVFRGLNRKEARAQRIIVSLTTFPPRINAVSIVLGLLLRQTCKPDKILLNLAQEEFKGKRLPLWLQLQRLCGVQIVYCNDLKPHKKYYYTMQKYYNDLIITVDDDLFLDRDLIEKLYNSYLRHPEAVHCCRTHLITFDEKGDVKPYSQWQIECSDYIGVPSMQLFGTNGAGTLFPPHCLHEEAFQLEKILSLCLWADDLWLKVMQVMNNTPVVLISPNQRLKYIDGTQESALWRNNITRNENDIQLYNTLSVYDTYWGLHDTLVSRIRRNGTAEIHGEGLRA